MSSAMTTGAALALVVAAVVLPGCGGGTDEATSEPRQSATTAPEAGTKSGETPTKRKFLREADAICAEARRRAAPISAAVDRLIANEDAAGVADQLRKALPIADELLRKMRALGSPKGDEAIVRRYLAIVAEQKGRIPSLVEALEAEDISTIEVLAAELREGNRKADRLARRYGFKKCGTQGLPNG